LQWVLHDWNDELSVKILKKCKEAISGKGKEGKVIIIDIAIDETSDDGELTELKLDYDLVMLTMFNGKEREREKSGRNLFTVQASAATTSPLYVASNLSSNFILNNFLRALGINQS